MLSASFYAGFSVISFYKGFLLNPSILEKLVRSPGFERALGILNEYYLPMIKEPIVADRPIQFETELQSKTSLIFKDLSRFFSGDMAEFINIYYFYYQLIDAVYNLRLSFGHSMDDEQIAVSGKSPFYPVFEQFRDSKSRRPAVFYENKLYQVYFDEVITILDKIEADELSYELMSIWMESLNIRIIHELASSYGYAPEEIGPFLLQGGDLKTNRFVKELSRYEVPKEISKHPLLKDIDLEEPSRFYTGLIKNLRQFAFKGMSGIPFRYSFYVCFFIVLLMDFELLKILFKAKFYHFETETIADILE